MPSLSALRGFLNMLSIKSPRSCEKTCAWNSRSSFARRCLSCISPRSSCSHSVLYTPCHAQGHDRSSRRTSGHIWPRRAIYGLGDVWPCMALLGHTWPYVAMYDHAWSRMAIQGHVWPHMAMYGHAWPCMAMHSHVGQSVAMYGHACL